MKKLFTYLLLLVTVITMQINGHQTSAKDAQAEERVVVTLGFDESRPLPINGETEVYAIDVTMYANDLYLYFSKKLLFLI